MNVLLNFYKLQFRNKKTGTRISHLERSKTNEVKRLYKYKLLLTNWWATEGDNNKFGETLLGGDMMPLLVLMRRT